MFSVSFLIIVCSVCCFSKYNGLCVLFSNYSILYVRYVSSKYSVLSELFLSIVCYVVILIIVCTMYMFIPSIV